MSALGRKQTSISVTGLLCLLPGWTDVLWCGAPLPRHAVQPVGAGHVGTCPGIIAHATHEHAIILIYEVYKSISDLGTAHRRVYQPGRPEALAVNELL